jgi:hypothetical protein
MQAHRTLRQEDQKFEDSMGYIVRPCVKTKRKWLI